jgi:hypothetical protein
MTERHIPDRSKESGLQATLDHGPRATTATNSDEEQETTSSQAPPDAEEVEKMTGVAPDSKELSTI